MTPRVKVCGLTNWEDVSAVAHLGADYLGFILSESSPRYITPQRAKEFGLRIKDEFPSIQTVSVITKMKREQIESASRQAGCDWVQVHSDIGADEFNQLNIVNKIKVFRVKEALSLEQITSFEAPFYLFDTFKEGQLGGTGEAFNWAYIPKEIHSRAFMAGGISPETIPSLLHHIIPYAIDVNSGVESSPGKKDLAKVGAVFDSILR
ncbi:MAG: phosphoribosylanthranilate isomerase [Candidatus Margulisiibacteriota bacterium]